jgi:hypothetical protein
VLEKVDFTLAARRKGHSTNLASYNTYSEDRIISPKKGYANCWSLPRFEEQISNPREMDWSVLYKTVRFKD